MKKSKKLLSILLAALLLITAGSIVVSAEEPAQPDMDKLHQEFIVYLDEQGITHDFGGEDSSSITFITQTNGWAVFYGTPGWAGNTISFDRLGAYIIVSQLSEAPYEIGLYAEKRGNVFTLKEANETGEINLEQVISHIDSVHKLVYFSGDVNGDGEIAVSDVIEVQKVIAKYLVVSQEKILFPFYDYDGNGVIEVKDAFDMQKMIAKVTE